MAFYRRFASLFAVAAATAVLAGCGNTVIPVKDPQVEIQVNVVTPLEFTAVDTFKKGTPGDFTATPPTQPVEPTYDYLVDKVSFTFINKSLAASQGDAGAGATIELLYMDFAYEDKNNIVWPMGTFARPWRQSLGGMTIPPGGELGVDVTLVPSWMKTDNGGLIDRLFFGYTDQGLTGGPGEGAWFFAPTVTSTFFSDPEREAAKQWTAFIRLVYRDSITGVNYTKDMKLYFGMGPVKSIS